MVGGMGFLMGTEGGGCSQLELINLILVGLMAGLFPPIFFI